MQLRLTSTLQAQAHAAHTQSKAVPNALSSPLSALPARVLLRSLLVSTVSSKRYFLIPALSVMSFLCKPNRIWLFDVDRNPLLHKILKKTFYDQFCAGENGAQVKSTMQELKDMGFRGVIMTYAKETVFDHKTNSQHGLGIAALKNEHGDVSIDAPVLQCPSIESWREGTVKTVDMLEGEDCLAVKYVDIPLSDDMMTDAL
jgi:hypothetical protein